MSSKKDTNSPVIQKMKFTTSALISAIAIVQLAVVVNASPVLAVGDDHSQHHLEKRGLGELEKKKLLNTMGIGKETRDTKDFLKTFGNLREGYTYRKRRRYL
jgi:hypothetical protein